MSWDNLTEKDKIELDRNIETLQKAFYREIETGDSLDSGRIYMELSRLRAIKISLNKCAECGNEKPIEEILCLHCWCLQNNIACCGEDDEE